jgi:ketosteroid isomerase-like protein
MHARGYGNHGGLQAELTVVGAIYEAFARRDVEAALAHIAEDIEFLPRGTAELTGRTEPYRGHHGVREYFADAARVWDDLTLHADDMRVVLGSVVVFGHVDGLVGGRPVRRRVIWNWQVRDGKASGLRINDLGEAAPT